LAGENSFSAAVRETIEEVGIDLNNCIGEVVFTKTRTFINGEKFNDIMDFWLLNIMEMLI
jgi:8-oxo-dGTP pyrophosphatase MutT (NUDIX family)